MTVEEAVKNPATKKSKEKEHVLRYKLLYSCIIILAYMVGRNIALYGVDTSYYQDVQLDAQSVIYQAVSGDTRNYSIFTLGLWSYMMASMLMMIVSALLSHNRALRVSPKRVNKVTMAMTMIFAAMQAFTKMETLVYKADITDLLFTKFIVFLQMICGLLIVICLCERMTKYGIGGRTTVFIVNVLDGIGSMITGLTGEQLIIPLVIGYFEIMIMLFMELSEKRILVQRVSIHNIYAGKDYLAYKLNPIGVMPLMFASVVFLLPQFLCSFLAAIFPGNARLLWMTENMTLNQPLGIITYMLVICALNITFSFIMLSPGDMADNLLRSGDSIVNVYAGKQTKQYLRRTIAVLSIVSSIVMAICQGGPLFLQFRGYVDSQIVMLPSSIMMLAGMWITFRREAQVYENIDSYKLLV